MSRRDEAFDPLVAGAKARVVALVEDGVLARDDGEFLLRALIDLESDGIELFDPALPADEGFYTAVGDYLVARAGRVAVDAQVLERAATVAPSGRELDRAVLRLITNQGGRA